MGVPMEAPTERQLKVLAFIHRSTQTRGFPPTLREIADEFQFSSANGARDHLRALGKKGLVRQTGGTARSTRPTRRALAVLGELPADSADSLLPIAVPVVGRFTPGTVVQAI